MQPPSDFSGITASSGIAELTALRRAYAAGALSPRQVVDMLVAKSGEYDEYNVWIIPPAQMPLQSYLERLDNLDPGDTQRYPLWGIPFAIKDNIDLAGVCTTAGCPGYSYLPDKNATVVQRLIEAGAIPVGKTNLDQFATGLVGTRSPYGECCNALRPELLSGGSSSGSAVSVALGLASFALGSDTAGSGRVPAALNGIYGLKPPRGSWSNSGLVPACASLDCITVFANSLADLQLVDSVASGYDSNCPWSRDDLQRSGGGGGDIVANSADLPAVIYLPAEQPRFFGPFAQSYQQRWLAFTTRLREA
ncbi:MAG: hypothetical protein LBR39_04310, partial [Coriobacteriales bacterium]|nr:hypothetical protein [Coriobacteriales bacterium]